MSRLKVGVIGAGGVAQVEHIPNLLRLPALFDLKVAADPSSTSRDFVSGRYGVPTVADPAELLAMPLDAVVIASPDALHYAHVSAALDAGLHVFCEKPLCYASEDILKLAAQRDRAGRVLQAGYMKRFDPSYEALLARLPDQSGTLLQVAVEVYDPDAAPFIRHHEWQLGSDLPPEAGQALRAMQAEQVARAVKVPLDETGFRGFCAAYASSIVHDVNAVHGILDALGTTVDGVTGAALFAGGIGGQGAVSLNGGAALWTMSHLTTPSLPHYSERITLTFEGSALELEFPSPWLNHAPTRLTERRGHGLTLQSTDIRTGYEEAFVEELMGFHRAICGQEAVRNTAEAAARDMDLLAGLAAWHMTHNARKG
ncbi:Gfo/Idh/MocA family oxidoreductase [Tabrizicola sp. J26]|uniref:Gfo/Idh/MocA family protein n=1 Tax=Alitabrizicola rongguiensis TaxID=2909234 RepID=UPI001F24CAAB|nr:Gfo/Idh/MocA family oxidoreductase [Tabrizicola rongguiensis]MCF1707188.1 Gfo/Idh/MocA family oxidoreductase [Tabrizicola rongguiensis]